MKVVTLKYTTPEFSDLLKNGNFPVGETAGKLRDAKIIVRIALKASLNCAVNGRQKRALVEFQGSLSNRLVALRHRRPQVVDLRL
jgi:hypothetical protein